MERLSEDFEVTMKDILFVRFTLHGNGFSQARRDFFLLTINKQHPVTTLLKGDNSISLFIPLISLDIQLRSFNLDSPVYLF